MKNLLFVAFTLICFALSPAAHAVSPPPDGDYPGQNTAEGLQALLSLTTGVWNTALGFQALKSDTTGNSNTATGGRALFSNTTGFQNTANGAFALRDNTGGGGNSAFGFNALTSNTTGNANTGVGANALTSNTTGVSNTGIGAGALSSNTSGKSNTATGDDALAENTTGVNNTANGAFALHDNTDGAGNSAFGWEALESTTTGDINTAVGFQALRANTTGTSNTAIGHQALFFNTGSNNTALGEGAGSGVTTADNVICIGSSGADVDNSCFIGNIRGRTTQTDAIPVVIDGFGQLGTISSSRRFKNEIKPMDQTSEAILALKPVTFHYKSDASGTPQFGLIAEEVAEVNPGLVVRDEKGEIYTVRYDAVNAMLLNEFLKEHKKVEEQQSTIAQLKKDFQANAMHQQKQIEALTAGLQKVSAQLELNQSTPQTVLNNQ